jgi:hypothetical protein
MNEDGIVDEVDFGNAFEGACYPVTNRTCERDISEDDIAMV